MSRVAYERVFGQSGYDAVARNKIKKLEEKIGGGSGSGGGEHTIDLRNAGRFFIDYNGYQNNPYRYQFRFDTDDLREAFMKEYTYVFPQIVLFNIHEEWNHIVSGYYEGVNDDDIITDLWLEFHDHEERVHINFVEKTITKYEDEDSGGGTPT